MAPINHAAWLPVAKAYAGSQELCFEIAAKVDGHNFVSCAMPIKPEEVPQGLSAKFIMAGRVAAPSKVGEMIWGKFLPVALANGTFKSLPEPVVVGQGLDRLQEAVYRVKTGAKSAQKLVVTL